MKKWFIWLFVFVTSVMISACSQNDSKDKGNVSERTEEMSLQEGKVAIDDVHSVEEDMDHSKQDSLAMTTSDRKVMYNAHIRADVSDLEKVKHTLEKEATTLGGYVVQANVTEMEQQIEGFLSFRIPQGKMEEFIDFIQKQVDHVSSEQVSGIDVTEEYVDLQSRLSSKQSVEKRLIELMDRAEKMEDVLNISSELAKVQEEIEQIKGRIQYLENKTDYATVDVYLLEEKGAEVAADKLNTWEKVKNQWNKSINGLLLSSSSIAVFIVGNLPIWIIIGGVIFLFVIGRKKIFSKFTKNKKSDHGEK
ncbi:DUF4349 domain-containing protein [Bacillus sp. FJAT-47783]|uniref:DUF4349 domain-containing protein n=1 Tax=Bacillus sp. FJAT-47783 TaxID=2922712 RepID=UPI001FAB5B2C|nr:DUF4349 domain-containing protein [Bacillus sp. FJAT-47783]